MIVATVNVCAGLQALKIGFLESAACSQDQFKN